MAKITYKRLINVLTKLKFVKVQSSSPFQVFRHVQTQTLVALPAAKPDALVSPSRLAAIRLSIIGANIATQSKIDTLLADAKPQAA